MAHDMSIRAYAKHRGVTPAAVRKAIKTGRITTQSGKIDPGIADAQWRSNTDEAKPRNSVSGRPGGMGRFPGALSMPTVGRGDPVVPRAGGYAAARAVRETYEARLRELDYKVRTGELVPLDKVRVAAFNTNRRARDLLLAIPDRVAPIVAALTDASEIHRVLSEEFRRVCEELSLPSTFGSDDHTDPH